MYVYTGRPSLKDQKKLANTSSKQLLGYNK